MPTQIRIVGKNQLKGTIQISGAKNAALPLMAASLLTDKKLILDNMPHLADIQSMAEILQQHGVHINHHSKSSVWEFQASNITNFTAPYELVSKLRASVLVLGPLVAKFGEARVSLPGGCAIGVRPIDIHLNGLKLLGADIGLTEGYICAKAPRGLIGTTINMPVISVTSTENIMMAACLAKGETHIINAAREPEIIDLARCLNSMGANIQGAGTDHITIHGVNSLTGTKHTVIPDRIEAGTYAMAALITGGDVIINGIDESLLPTVFSTLKSTGADIQSFNKCIHIKPSLHSLKGVDVMTEPFPGFATDLQAQFMALMTLCNGASMITETIWENRFMHVPELCRMGANITVHGSSAMVRGVKKLSGAPVMATDLRASVSLVLAALAANGESFLNRVYHLDRGYEKFEQKLEACGAHIERIKT